VEEIRRSTKEIHVIFEQIQRLLNSYKNAATTASYTLLSSVDAVINEGFDLKNSESYSKAELADLIGSITSFNRHFSEVEQSIYEEIGSTQFDSLQDYQKSIEIPFSKIYKHFKTL
jgi:hypothetical protein